MQNITLKELRAMVNARVAVDITNYTHDQTMALLRSRDIDRVACASGVYGVTGCLLRDYATGEKFAVLRRCATLLQVL